MLVSGVEQVIKLFFVVGPEPGSALITIYEVFHDPPGAPKHFILMSTSSNVVMRLISSPLI